MLCDIYLQTPLNGNSLLIRQLRIFQREFFADEHKEYCGFLNLNIPRIKAVAVVTHFRNNRVHAINVPIKYRDSPRLSVTEAQQILQSTTITSVGRVVDKNHPMFYIFYVNDTSRGEINEGGGHVTIDSLDGHRWTSEEMEEYMYDYNNLL